MAGLYRYLLTFFWMLPGLYGSQCRFTDYTRGTTGQYHLFTVGYEYQFPGYLYISNYSGSCGRSLWPAETVLFGRICLCGVIRFGRTIKKY